MYIHEESHVKGKSNITLPMHWNYTRTINHLDNWSDRPRYCRLLYTWRHNSNHTRWVMAEKYFYCFGYNLENCVVRMSCHILCKTTFRYMLSVFCLMAKRKKLVWIEYTDLGILINITKWTTRQCFFRTVKLHPFAMQILQWVVQYIDEQLKKILVWEISPVNQLSWNYYMLIFSIKCRIF